MKRKLVMLAIAALTAGAMNAQHYVEQTSLPTTLPLSDHEFWSLDGIIHDGFNEVDIISSTYDVIGGFGSGYTIMQYTQTSGTPVNGWHVSANTDFQDAAGMVKDANGKFYVAGTFYGAIQQIALSRTNAVTGGSALRLVNITATLGSPIVRGIASDPYDGIYLIGDGIVLSGPSAGQTDIFVARFDTTLALSWLTVLQHPGFNDNAENISYYPGVTVSDRLYIGALTESVSAPGKEGLLIQMRPTGTLATGATSPKRIDYLTSGSLTHFYVKRDGADFFAVASSALGTGANGPMMIAKIDPANLTPLTSRFYDPGDYVMTSPFNFLPGTALSKNICLSGKVPSTTLPGNAHLFFNMTAGFTCGWRYTENAGDFFNTINGSGEIFSVAFTDNTSFFTSVTRHKTKITSTLTTNCENAFSVTLLAPPTINTVVASMTASGLTPPSTTPPIFANNYNFPSANICFNPVAPSPARTMTDLPVPAGIYPNPATDKATVTFPGEEIAAALEVHDLTGRIVFSTGDLNDHSFEMDTKGWTPGLYLVQLIYADGRMESWKLMKN